MIPHLALPRTRHQDAFPHICIESAVLTTGLKYPWCFTEHFFRRETGLLLEGFVDEQNSLLWVAYDDTFGAMIQNLGPQLHTLFGFDAFGYVASNSRSADDPSGYILDGRYSDVDINLFPALSFPDTLDK